MIIGRTLHEKLLRIFRNISGSNNDVRCALLTIIELYLLFAGQILSRPLSATFFVNTTNNVFIIELSSSTKWKWAEAINIGGKVFTEACINLKSKSWRSADLKSRISYNAILQLYLSNDHQIIPNT